MNWTNFIRSLGFENPTSMLDPSGYSDEELEEDLLTIEMDRGHAKSMQKKKENEYEAKLDEINEADEWEEEDLLRDADDIEIAKEDWRDEWRQLGDQKRLLKAIKSFRRRINIHGRDLNISEMLKSSERSEVRSELRDALREHLRSNKQVQNLLQEFTNARNLDRQQTRSNNRDLSKHRKRAEQRKNGGGKTGSTGPGNRSRDGDDKDGTPTATGDD